MWLFFTLPLISLVLALFVHASETVDSIRSNWDQHRCNPLYMPFAGYLHEKTTAMENLYKCTNTAGRELLKVPLDGILSMFNLTNSSLSEVVGSIPLLRAVFGRIRKVMLSFAASVFSKIASSTSIFVHYLIKIRDLMKRFVGEGYIAGYLTYGIVSFLESFVVLFLSILKTFVLVMLAISFALALFQPELLAVVLVLASLLAASGA